MKYESVVYRTEDGRKVVLSEPDDHVLQLEIDGQVLATFSQTGVTIDNILKEVKADDRRG